LEITPFEIIENKRVATDTYCLTLRGDCTSITVPGQFVNIELPGFFLRRPLSVARVAEDVLTLAYKIVGSGTLELSEMQSGSLELLTGLGNGFNPGEAGDAPLLIGGGAGAAPLLWLAEFLVSREITPWVALGFNSADEVFFASEFMELGAKLLVATLDGSSGAKGFVTDAVTAAGIKFDYVYSCGPEPMLKAVYDMSDTDGEFSFEERMACGFGACMGCSCETKYGSKRICRDGPVLKRNEIVW